MTNPLEQLFVTNTFEFDKRNELADFGEWFEKYFGSNFNKFERCLRAYRLFKSEVGLSTLIEIVATSKYGTPEQLASLKERLGIELPKKEEDAKP